MPAKSNILEGEELFIPVNDTIEEFRKHLLSHPRSILSARYGDGKSYFLQKVEEHETVKKEFVFLKLFPVNYQVVENKDIFELIKYDLIFQLYSHGMLDYIQDLSKSSLFYWFCRDHKKDIVQFLCKAGAAIGILPDNMSEVIEKFNDLETKWATFMDGNGNDEMAQFMEKMCNHYLYEIDPVTSFIKEAIVEYRKNNNKKIVLVIEDLDRLDPAHLFRILNVLSAHVDYAYRYGCSPDRKSISGNKFDVDNVLLVMDDTNTAQIYHHFYGAEANFDGYINKFISNGVFRYSLTQEKIKYYVNYLSKETQIKESLIREIIPDSYFEGKTIRTVASAIRDTQAQLFEVPVYEDINGQVRLSMGVLKLLVVMRRIGMSDFNIMNQLEHVISANPRDMMHYLGGYWLAYVGQYPSVPVYIKVPYKDDVSYCLKIIGVRGDGTADISSPGNSYNEYRGADNMQQFVQYLLYSIAK